MTELTVRHEPSTGAAAIEIRGADLSETRFRLRDPSSDKYLTKRGWTKTASFLPVEAVSADGVLTLSLDADLARKIAPDTMLSLEQPGGFRQTLSWPAPAAAVAAQTADIDAPVDAPEPADDPVPEPLVLDSFEPSIMDEHLHPDAPAAEAPTRNALPADNDTAPSRWKPAAIAAIVFFVLGIGLSFVWSGSDSAAVRQARQAATIQFEKQKWEFDRQLAEARQQSSTASLDTSKATEAEIASLSSKSTQLVAERDAAQKALADKEKSIAALQKQLADATAQTTVAQNAAKDEERVEATAQIGARDGKIAALTGELDKANGALAQRDQALRDAQASLSAVKEQVTASQALATQAKQQLGERETTLRDVQRKLDTANDETAALRDAAKSQAATQNTSLSEKINRLTAEVKQNEQLVAERDSALRDVQAKLSVANIQVDALKVVAGKTTEAGLEKTAMSQKLSRMTVELDKTSQSLSDREQALEAATARLRETETKLAAALKRNDAQMAEAPPELARQPEQATMGDTTRLQEERDLYANELETMTTKFSTLQTQKVELEKTVAALQAQIKEANLTTSQIPSKAVWGATAIDQTGAIYSLQNQTGEKAAQDNVTAMCRGKSGGRCEALTAYANACFSVARFQGEGPASDNYAYFVHKDWKMASQTALERCQSMGASCTVRFTACSPDALSKPVSE